MALPLTRGRLGNEADRLMPHQIFAIFSANPDNSGSQPTIAPFPKFDDREDPLNYD